MRKRRRERDKRATMLLPLSRRLLPSSTLSLYTSLSTAAPTQLPSSLRSWYYTEYKKLRLSRSDNILRGSDNCRRAGKKQNKNATDQPKFYIVSIFRVQSSECFDTTMGNGEESKKYVKKLETRSPFDENEKVTRQFRRPSLCHRMLARKKKSYLLHCDVHGCRWQFS